MSQFGLPYMGSKDKIIPSIAMLFPKAEHFYDLFGGGFSVSHYMIERKSTRYSYFHYNEIKSDIVEIAKKAINGYYNYDKFKPEWISREDFFRLKDSDPYIKICWSFGNSQKGYMFGHDIEPYKKSMHMAVVFNEFDDLAAETLGFSTWPNGVNSIKQKRFYLRQKIEFYRVNDRIPKCLHQFIPSKQLEQLERLQQLERLEQLQQLQQLEQLLQLERLQRLQQLQQLKQLQQLSFTSVSYDKVEILPDSIIYCDPPYANTAEYYGKEFDKKKFLDWADAQKVPVFISEYNISDTRFKLFATRYKRSMLAGSKKKADSSFKLEKLYANAAFTGLKAVKADVS